MITSDSKLKDFILKVKILRDEDCKKIINILETKKFDRHTWLNDNYEVSSRDKNELEVFYTEKDKTLRTFFSGVTNNALHFYKRKVNPLDFAGSFCPTRINRYSSNQDMESHCDFIKSLFTGEQRGIPVVSIVGSLNDDFEGGRLIFNNDYDFELKTGEVVVFPSTFLYEHKVTAVSKGQRYSFVSWAW